MALPSKYVVATMRYGVPGRPLQLNVLWYTCTGTSTAPDPQTEANDIAEAIQAMISPNLADCVTTETTCIGVEATVNTGGSAFVGVSAFTDLAGTVVGDTLPEYCAVVVQKRTAAPGRSGRGRWFLGCVPESFADNSSVEDTAKSAYTTMLNPMSAPLTVDGLTLTPQLHSALNDSLTPIVVLHIDDQLGTQRRRRVRPLL